MAAFSTAFPQAAEVIIDGMERPIQRPQKRTTPRKHYSGKKKRHTRKTIVIVDQTRRIGYLSPGKRGARHDKRVCDQRQMMPNIPPTTTILADSGFQGVRHPGICLPFKGTRRRPLDGAQRQWNTQLASLRAVVEHCIGGMKRFAAVAGIYRNRRPKTDDQFNLLAAGLWNYSLT